MVTRSLLIKSYLYAIGVMAIAVMLLFAATHLLLQHNMDEEAAQLGRDMATFVGHEAEASFHDGAPSASRLAELSRAVHFRLAYVPADPHHPERLPSAKVTTLRGPKGWIPRYEIRLDVGGKPQGVLRAQPRWPHPGARARAIFAIAVMLGLALMIVPPLMVWVLGPIRRMVAVAHRLGEGDLQTPVPILRKDEFGDLERAFERLRIRIIRMLQQKERLLSDISHELRGPLSRMAIALPLLRTDHPKSPYLDHMDRDQRAMEDLIDELLALAREQEAPPQSPQALDLAALAEDALHTRALSFDQSGLTLETRLDPVPVSGHERSLLRALGNLLDNALKYAPEGCVEVATILEGDEAVFRVRNGGPGIDPADLPQIFEPFYRPDRSRSRASGGAGLGLAIVKAIAERHGGRAIMASTPGLETTAELRLPKS